MQEKINKGKYSHADFDVIFHYDNSALIKLFFSFQKNTDQPDIYDSNNELSKKIIAELDGYFSGKIKKFSLKVNPKGTDFQKKVWKELVKIRFGQTKTYKDIAVSINNPKAARAVGMACNKNPVPVVIPCHRVIGSKGDLVGYNGGIKIKKWLLDFERKNDK